MLQKCVELAILGYGDRSSCYAEYAVLHPNKAKIVAVIDINPLKLNEAKAKFNLPDDKLFLSLDDFLDKNIPCDAVINGTMDQLHYETTIKLLNKKYNLLLEKPITASVDELLEIEALSRKNDCKVIVCHVLRYTPFYSAVKKIIDSGELGKITSIQMNEHVWHGHFVNSFVRGKYRSEKEIGSGLLLAKCCHDTDLLCWLNSASEPLYVSSFGSKSLYTKENAPEGSTEYCYNCPHNKDCMFDAYKFELEKDFSPSQTWAGINKPLDEITIDEKIEFLKNDVYGKCVFKTDMDIVDRQCVSVAFKNGSIATLNMIGGTTKAGRNLHIVCEMGEIVGSIEENSLTVRRYDKNNICEVDEEITLKEENPTIDHYGADYYIMEDFVAFLSGNASPPTTVIEDSINGHLVCYAAEKSRKEKSIVSIEKEYNEKTD